MKQIINILTQLEYIDNVEFLVSDNCSTDGSYETFVKLFSDNTKVQFFRQKENLGLVGNIHFLFNRSFGKYLWFISDDDIILDGSVNKLIKKLFNTSKPYFLLNFKTETEGDISEATYWSEGSSPENCFRQNWGGFGLLSAEIMEKDCFNGLFSLTKNQYNLCQPVIYSLYGIFLKGGEIITDDIFLLYHIGPTSWDKYKLEVESIYNFKAVDQISSLISKGERKYMLELLVSSDDIKNGCLLYIIKKRSYKFAYYLFREGLLFKILSFGLMKVIRKISKK